MVLCFLRAVSKSVRLLLDSVTYAQLFVEVLLSPSSVVLRLAQANRFNTAMATARTLQVDMTDTFSLLTRQCLRLSHSLDAVLYAKNRLFCLVSSHISPTGRRTRLTGCSRTK